MPFAEMWTDLESVIESEVSQKEKNILSLTCGIHKKWYACLPVTSDSLQPP